MSQKSDVITLTGVSAYPASPQIVTPFQPDTYYVRIESGTPGVFISFDGANDALHVLPLDVLVPIPCKAQKVWLKEDGAGVSTCRVSALTKI
jgi:hypothetical protein